MLIDVTPTACRLVVAGCKTHVHLEVLVDRRSATELNIGKDQLKENLIIRVQGGDDLRVSFDNVFFI